MIKKKFDILGKVSVFGSHDFALAARGWYREGLITIRNIEWDDPWKKEHPDTYPIKVDKDGIWVTYASCADTKVSNTDKGIEVEVIVWDGDNMDGYRNKKRFTAVFDVVSDKIFDNKRLVSAINCQFDGHIADVHEKREREKYKKELKKIEKELLS